MDSGGSWEGGGGGEGNPTWNEKSLVTCQPHLTLCTQHITQSLIITFYQMILSKLGQIYVCIHMHLFELIGLEELIAALLTLLSTCMVRHVESVGHFTTSRYDCIISLPTLHVFEPWIYISVYALCGFFDML